MPHLPTKLRPKAAETLEAPRDYTWRDAELTAKPLMAFNKVSGQLARIGIDKPSMDPAAVEAAAIKLAGCSDFGSDSYQEPLRLFLDSCMNEAELTPFGKVMVTKMCAAALANRLQLQRWATEHPEVRGEEIKSPWVIAGLPRTGTTILSNLLALDPMTRTLRMWESAHLIPPAPLESADEDPRIRQTAKELSGMTKLNPALGAIYPFGATLAQECVTLFMYDLRTLSMEITAHVPTYAHWLEKADMAPAYAQHKLALQTLQSTQPTERWVLKTPNHLWHLKALYAAYPDARVIWTHRDPGPVIASLASLANAAQRPQTSRKDPKPAAEEWKRKARFALDSATAFDDSSEPGWASHLHYAELMADPVGTVSKLYESFGEKVSNLHARRMLTFLQERPQGAHGRHRYDPKDFGWTYEGLSEEFSDYTQRYNVKSELKRE
jgi:hypothetical protein